LFYLTYKLGNVATFCLSILKKLPLFLCLDGLKSLVFDQIFNVSINPWCIKKYEKLYLVMIKKWC
jgi:hypothetical protein